MESVERSKPTVNEDLLKRYQKQYVPAWHSFDRHPWRHPWLTPENLSLMRDFSRQVREEAHRLFEKKSRRHQYEFGFVCNIANSMHSSARALTPHGAKVTLLMHPYDDYLLSQPEWELFDGCVNGNSHSYLEAVKSGLPLPEMQGVWRGSVGSDWVEYERMPPFVRESDYCRWRDYYCFLPMIEVARRFDSLFVIQAPYIAYLSKKPYIATHMGGDIWYECSRDDMLGHLQRKAFSQATLLIASNPWSYAFARRYGMRNMVYMPTILNSEEYSPGPAVFREEWEKTTGGTFFVLSTARVDELFKGSRIGLDGFARFAARHPNVRLIQLGWGADLEVHRTQIASMGLEEKITVIPLAGKRRLINYLRSADCLLDQFVVGYYGMTALEAMAVGLPVIMRLEAAQYDAFSDAGAPPVYNVQTAEEVADVLERLATSPEERMQAARKCRDWFMRYSGDAHWAQSYLDLLISAASGHRFSFSQSPLRSPLNQTEREYHRVELSNAPLFPNYF